MKINVIYPVTLLIALLIYSCPRVERCPNFSFGGTIDGTIFQLYNIPMQFGFGVDMDTTIGTITCEEWVDSGGAWRWVIADGNLIWDGLKEADWIPNMPDSNSTTGWSWDRDTYYRWSTSGFVSAEGCAMEPNIVKHAFNSCTGTSQSGCDSVPFPPNYP